MLRDRLRSLRKRGERVYTKVRNVTRPVVDAFPLTPVGLCVMIGGGFAFYNFGYKRQDLLLLVIGAVGVAVAILGFLLVSIVSLVLFSKYRKRSGGDPLKLECSIPLRTEYSMPTLWYVPMIKLAWSWVDPESTVRLKTERRRFHEEVLPTRRGLVDKIVRRIEVSDAFGLAKVGFKIVEYRAAKCMPSVGALKQVQVVRSISGGEDLPHPAGPADGDRADLRRYVPGDPVRYILWKVFAKSRTLVIRTPERALSPVRKVVAYLVTGDGDEPAAGAARLAVESGALGDDWVLGTDGNVQDAKTHHEALELLARSAKVPVEHGGSGLNQFLNRVSPTGGGRAVVFVPARPGPWLEQAVHAAKGRSMTGQPVSPVEFVVCTDGIERTNRRGWWSRVAYQSASSVTTKPNGSTPTAAEDVSTVLEALSAARAKVLLVDRLGGRVYTEGHRRALEAA